MSEPVSRTPFYKPDPRGWPAIAELLPKPWPEEAIAHDLVWWADQVAIGRVVKMPGAVTLAARWGLSRHSRRVRLALGYIVAPEGPVCCAGPGAYPARGWRAAGASVAHFLDDSDDCTSPAGAPLAHDWRVLGASVARDSDGQIDEESANDAAPDAAPRARGTEPRSQIPDPTHETHHAPAHEATDTPEVDGQAGVGAGPVPEQIPVRRPLPIRPVPLLPPATPSSPPSSCQNEHRTGRSNLAAMSKHPDEDLPMPEPDDVPVYELPDLLRPGDSVALPGTLDELLADARGMGRHIIGALRAAGIATTQELFERLPLESVPFTRGLAGARGNELIQHLGDRWCVFLRTKDDIDAINAKTVYAADRRRNATQAARAGLRVVGGEK